MGCFFLCVVFLLCLRVISGEQWSATQQQRRQIADVNGRSLCVCCIWGFGYLICLQWIRVHAGCLRCSLAGV